MEKDAIQQRIQALSPTVVCVKRCSGGPGGVATASKVLREGTTKIPHLEKLAEFFSVSYDFLASGDDAEEK